MSSRLPPTSSLSPRPRPSPFTSQQSYSEESLRYGEVHRDLPPSRQPSYKEWKEWKVDIRHWYLVEKKTQRDLSKLLCNKYGFRPTGKQLTKRLDDWGFKKNKSRRWRQLSAKNKVFTQRQDAKISAGIEGNRAFKQTEFTQSVEEAEKGKDRLRVQKMIPDETKLAVFVDDSMLDQICTDKGFEKSEVADEAPLNCYSWDSIVANLAHQLADMNIIFSAEILHTQKTENVPVTNPPQVYLASNDIRRLVDSERQPSQRMLFHHNRTMSSNLVHDDYLHHPPRQQSCFKFPDMDVDFPSSRLISSLSGELYPFPPSVAPKHSQSSRTTPTINITRKVLSGYCDSYERLKLIVPNNHPAMIQIMVELRRNYMELEKWSEAELWLRRELSARVLSGESVFSSEYLSAQLNLINVAMAQGQFEESKALHSAVHQTILESQNTRPDTSLFEDSLETIAWLLGDQGYIKESGKYFRDLLQVRLNYLGPCHTKTIHAMRQLGCNFRLQKRYHESEKLTTITVQLFKRGSIMPGKDLLNATSELSNIKFAQGHLEESEALDRELIASSEMQLGEEHPDTLMYMLNLAASLKHETRLEESEELVRKTITGRVKTLGEANLNTLESMKALGHILHEKECYDDASEWFEKSFCGRLAYLGSYHMRTVWVCDSLADCYISLGRPDKALLLLESFIQDIEREVSHRCREHFGDEMRFEILPWIGRFKERVEEIRLNSV